MSDNVYIFIINISTLLIIPCYFVSSIYLIKVSWKENTKNIVFGCLGILISIISLISFKIENILFDFVFYFIGCMLYILGNLDHGKSIIKKDIIITIIISVITIIGIIYLIIKWFYKFKIFLILLLYFYLNSLLYNIFINNNYNYYFYNSKFYS